MFPLQGFHIPVWHHIDQSEKIPRALMNYSMFNSFQQFIIFDSPGTLSQWSHIKYRLSFFMEFRFKSAMWDIMQCGNVANMPYYTLTAWLNSLELSSVSCCFLSLSSDSVWHSDIIEYAWSDDKKSEAALPSAAPGSAQLEGSFLSGRRGEDSSVSAEGGSAKPSSAASPSSPKCNITRTSAVITEEWLLIMAYVMYRWRSWAITPSLTPLTHTMERQSISIFSWIHSEQVWCMHTMSINKPVNAYVKKPEVL